MDLPFEEVGPIQHIIGEHACNFEHATGANRWMLIQAGAYVDEPVQGDKGSHYSFQVNPVEVMGFNIDVAPGSEPLNVLCCKYPAEIQVRGRMTRKGFSTTLKTKLRGWTGGSFCKTQYASNLGIPNFLRAHISVITILEYMQTLTGWEVDIRDEGDYGQNWSCPDWREADAEGRERVYASYPGHHDIPRLVAEVGEWNAMIASFAGAMKDNLPNGQSLLAPILAYKDFEHLEALGLKDMPPESLNLFLKACAAVPLPADEDE
jgi:hypothetical protein